MNIRKDLKVETLNKNFGYYIKVNEVLFSKKTKYQDLEILQTEAFGKMLRLDKVFQTSEKEEYLYHEPLVHVPGVTMNGPKKALVIGGGDGGAIEEFLKYNTLEKVYMVELDGEVVEACKKYIPNICKGAFESSKVDLRIEDGIRFIQKTNETFDQVMLDLTDPFGPSVALYTKEFYKEINKHLFAGGALSLHIESPISRPEVFGRLYRTLKSVFNNVSVMLNYVPLYGTLWAYAVASQELDVNEISKLEVDQRIKSLGLKDLQFYNGDTHLGLLSLPNYVRDILAQDHEIIEKTTELINEDEVYHNYAIIEEVNA